MEKMYVVSYITNINGKIEKSIHLYNNYNDALDIYYNYLQHDVIDIINLYNNSLSETTVNHINKSEHEIKLIDEHNIDILDMHLFDVIM